MNLDNTVIFVFLTILNVLMFVSLSAFAKYIWTEDEKAFAAIAAITAITACAGLEYLLIGGLLK